MQDNDTSRRRKFYDQMSEAYDLGSFEEFDAKMNNPESRKKLHDFIDQDGKYDIGDFEYFDNAMKPVETPKQQTTEQPAQTSAAPQQQVSTNGMQPAATNTPQTAAPVVEQKPAEPEYTQPYDAKGNVLTNNGQPYSQEALRRYYSPENKAPNYRDLSRIAADLEQEQSVSRMQTTGGAGFVPDRPMNAYEQQDAMMQKIAEQNKKASWRDEELNVGTDGSEEPKRSTKGEVYDQLYKQFDEAFKNGKMGDRSAYSIAREAAEKMGIKDDEQMTRTNQLLSNVNRQYAKAQAKNTVSAIMEKMPERSADPLQALQSLYYDRDLQNQIMQTAAKMGNDYDQYVNMFIKPQLIEAMKQKYGGTDNDWTSVKGLFSNWQHVTDRLESNDIGRMLGDYFAPAVDAAFKQADERANAVAQQYNESQSPYTDQGLDFGQIGAMRKANEARDPKQILADLENSLSGPITEILQNQQMTDEIFRRAEQRGMSVTDYIDQFVAPQLTDALRTQFEKTAVAREMPVNDFDYIMRGLNDSVVVMLIDRLTRTESQQYYRNLADAAAAEDRSVWTEGARLATGMASDFWLWAGWGKLGAKATGELMAKRVAERAAADHITISAARRLIEEEGKQFLDKGIVEGMMRHIPQSAVTMAGAEATSEAVRGIRDREEVAAIIGNTLGAAAGGGFTGTLFGVTGGVMGRLTSQLAGPARLAGKLAGFGVEASTMYTAEELQKMANGEDVFQNPYDGMIESIIKLGFIKASANPLATGVKLYEAVRHPVKSVKAAMTPDSPTLTEDEVRDIQDSQDGAALMEALVKMRPARSTDKEEREGYISEADAEIAAEAYREFMSNPNRPYITKQKVAHLLGGALPPAGLEVKADIIDTDNGALLQTRNVLGELIDQTRYDSREAAEKAAKDMATDLYNNETVALEEQVTKKDLFLRVKEKIDKEYQAIAEKFGDTSDQDITSRLTERERNILYLHQHLDELMDVYQKISDGQDLDVDGEKLASTFMQFFDRFMKDRGPVMDFRRKFEAGNNLMLGEIDKILEKEEARTESDEQILSAYKEAMRKHVWKEALEDLSNKPDLTDTTYEESPVEDVTSTETGGSEAEINGSSQSAEASSETISGASETPSDTQARREAAYDRGMAVVQDNSTLPAIGHDTRLAEARLMQQLPDSNPQLAKIRNQILAAIDNGEVDNVDLLIDDAVKNNLLNQQQLEAIEAYRDVAETQQGIQDAIAEQTKDFGDVVRMEMEDVASPDGTIREITLKDGSKVFYKSGDLDNQWGGVYATDLSGNARQVRVSEIVNISEPISVDDFVTNSINEYAAGLQEIYDGKASGQILDPGQQVDMIA